MKPSTLSKGSARKREREVKGGRCRSSANSSVARREGGKRAGIQRIGRSSTVSSPMKVVHKSIVSLVWRAHIEKWCSTPMRIRAIGPCEAAAAPLAVENYESKRGGGRSTKLVWVAHKARGLLVSKKGRMERRGWVDLDGKHFRLHHACEWHKERDGEEATEKKNERLLRSEDSVAHGHQHARMSTHHMQQINNKRPQCWRGKREDGLGHRHIAHAAAPPP